MSADNWTQCPRCTARREAKIRVFEKAVADLYGKVTVEEFDTARVFADNLLKVLKVAITSSAALRPITAGEDPDHPGRVRLTFKTENAWAYWVTKLGESPFAPDAAVREPVNGEWVHRWMSSDAGIVCEHFEISHTTDNFRSHP